jgi:hypothetical protein
VHQFNNLDDIEKHQHTQSDFTDNRSKKLTYNSTVILYEGTFIIRNAFFMWGTYALFIQKSTFENVKKFKQKLCMHISTFYVRMTKFHGKPIFLVLCVERTKNVSCKPLF